MDLITSAISNHFASSSSYYYCVRRKSYCTTIVNNTKILNVNQSIMFDLIAPRGGICEYITTWCSRGE